MIKPFAQQYADATICYIPANKAYQPIRVTLAYLFKTALSWMGMFQEDVKMTMPIREPLAPYPETAQPQNDMVLRACAGRENTFEYRHTEAQGGN